MKWIILVAALLTFQPLAASAETPDEWVTLGSRVHVGFGSFIPLGRECHQYPNGQVTLTSG